MLFVVNVGIGWGETIVDAAFLAQVGVHFLPYAFIVNALFSILAIAIYAAFADRVSNDKLLIAILGLSGSGGVLGLLLLELGWVKLAYPLFYFILNVPLLDIFIIHWATYVNGFYDTQSAKRILPIVAAAARIGGILAGLSMPLLNRFLLPGGIITIWLGSLLIMAALAWLMPTLLREKPEPGTDSLTPAGAMVRPKAGPRSSHLNNLAEGYHFVIQSSFLRWMALTTLFLMILLPLLNFRASQILLAEFGTTQAIADFVGPLNGWANLIMLPVQLFLISRIIGRVGLGQAHLIYPLLTLVICIFLIAAPFLSPLTFGALLSPLVLAAALAHLDRTALRATLNNSTDKLLYNAVPLRVKGRTRAFIGGLMVPIGGFIGGLLLLAIPLMPVDWFLPAVIGLLALIYGLSSFFIRQEYKDALIKILEQEDYSFLLAAEALDFTVSDPTTLERLRQKLVESDNYEFKIFMATLLSQTGGQAAVPILAEVARNEAEARLRAAFIDVLVAADVGGEAVRQLYLEFLNDPEGQVRQSALVGLEQSAGSDSKEFLDLALPLLADPDPDMQALVLTHLLQANDAFYQTAAGQTLNQTFLQSPSAALRSRGLRVLNQVADLRFIDRLIDFLTDPADAVRLEAVLAIETLSGQKIAPPVAATILAAVSPLGQDPIERVRQAVLVILGRLGQQAAYETIITALTDRSPQIRTTAVDVLVQIGKAAIPSVHAKLDSPDSQLRKMATVILSRINQRDFGPLVDSHVTGNLLAIYRTYGYLAALEPYAGYGGISVIQSVLREQSQALLEEIFYLLKAIHDPNDVQVVADSLRSDDGRVRANAVEALEALTSPQTANLIAPLFESTQKTAKLFSLSKEMWDMTHPNTGQVLAGYLKDPHDLWLRTIATFALGEIGAAIAPLNYASQVTAEAGPAPEQAPAPPQAGDPERVERDSRRPRRPVADLFQALTENDESSPAEEAEPARKRRRGPADLLSVLGDPDQATGAESLNHDRRRDPQRLGRLLDKPTSHPEKADQAANPPLTPAPTTKASPFTLAEIEIMLDDAFADPMIEVRLAARAAHRILAGMYAREIMEEEGVLLSIIEKIIFLREVPFFAGMTINQLKVLANVCEERLFEEDEKIFNQGDTGGTLYVVVSGQVGIEQERRRGSFARLATLGPHAYFGEATLFDSSPHTASAIALQDTLTLRLRREPLIALARQYPDLSLELINVLSLRLREANDRVAELTRTRTRKLQKFYDTLE
jgi:CRP-like cAMP-binding protein/HEAT repeat protein